MFDISPARVLEVFGNLLRVYLQYAWPFLIGHVAILASIFWDPLRPIFREIRALRSWTAGGPPGSGCAALLTQFVRETEHWGSHGILVPMTDFSDRLDSRVSGLLDSLHSRVNLFLVVGIAGTFFAMFQFAAGARTASPEQISKDLATALAQAFPVGFVGLVMTVLGHFCVAMLIEPRLRSAVTEATQRAMSARLLAAKGPAERLEEALEPLKHLEATLAGSLEPVIQAFREQLKETSRLIEEQIRPLANAVGGFQGAVALLVSQTDTLTRAIGGLPAALERTDQIQADSRRQLETIQRAVEEIGVATATAMASLREAVDGMAAVPAQLQRTFAGELENMARQATELWQNASQQFFTGLEPVRGALENSAARLAGAAEVLQSAPEGLRRQVEVEMQNLAASASAIWRDATEQFRQQSEQWRASADALARAPSELLASFDAQLGRLASASEDAWRKTGDQFFRDLQQNVLNWSETMRRETGQACEALTQAAKQIQVLSNSAQATLEGALVRFLDDSAEKIRPRLEALENRLRTDYPQLLADLNAAAADSSTLASGTRQCTQEMAQVLSEISAARQQWREVTAGLEQALSELRRRALEPPQPTPASDGQEVRQIRVTLERIEKLMDRRERWWPPWPFRGSRKGRGDYAPMA